MATILLADDDRELLEMYVLWLDQEETWTIRTATDGDEALENLDGAVDVAVLDRQMPKTPGSEVAQRIQSSPRDCRVLIASAYQPDSNIDEGVYDGYLTKPVQRSELVEAVRSELNDSLQAEP